MFAVMFNFLCRVTIFNGTFYFNDTRALCRASFRKQLREQRRKRSQRKAEHKSTMRSLRKEISEIHRSYVRYKDSIQAELERRRIDRAISAVRNRIFNEKDAYKLSETIADRFELIYADVVSAFKYAEQQRIATEGVT